MTRHPAVPYVAPFLLFIALLAASKVVPIPEWAWFLVVMAVILAVSRPALRGAPSNTVLSVLLGVAVFAIWIGPDVLIPGYRTHWLFNNSILGHPVGTTPEPMRSNTLFLAFRVLTSVVAVPILEELFWRGWLMRWLIDKDFESVPLGKYRADAFWIVALLFASEHGPYWDVGLITGALYNWWMVRTRNLWDCIIAHAVTNACLAAWVIGRGEWQYWL